MIISRHRNNVICSIYIIYIILSQRETLNALTTVNLICFQVLSQTRFQPYLVLLLFLKNPIFLLDVDVLDFFFRNFYRYFLIISYISILDSVSLFYNDIFENEALKITSRMDVFTYVANDNNNGI